MTHETQQSITLWADETFGPDTTNFRIATRANEEMAELLRAVAVGDDEKAKEEAADVAIVLCRLATRLEMTLEFAEHSLFSSKNTPEHLAALASNKLASAMVPIAIGQHRVLFVDDVQDCVSLLISLAERLGTTLQAEIDKKMAVNRNRVWKKDGSGHGYHVRQEN